MKRQAKRLLTRLLVAAALFPAAPALATSIAQLSPPAPAPAPANPQAPTAARVLYVNSSTGNDSGTGDQSAPFRTITRALQQAQAGTVIQLAPGNYTQQSGETFPLVLPAGVVLQGDAANKGQGVSIVGSGKFISPTFAEQNITIQAQNNSTISGISVTNPATRGTAIWVESTNPTIRDSTFTKNNREGVFVTGSGNPTIESNVFLQNGANGISVVRTAKGVIQNNLFQSTGFAIAIGDNSSPAVSNNQIAQNTDGVVVSQSARPVLRGNVIENSSRNGVVAIDDAAPDLGTANNPGGNVFRNNAAHDIYNATYRNTLTAIGNQVDSKRISGQVELAAQTLPPGGFKDVNGHWAQPFIEALASRGIITGFSDGTYHPDDPVTRAQYAVIISKAFKPSPKRSPVSFNDIAPDFWGRQSVQSAYQGQFMSGYPGRLFQPNQKIPRFQVLVSLASGLQLGNGDPGAVNRYQDASQILDWAKGAVAATTQRNIVVNYPNVAQLNPNREATRAEVAAMVYQALVSTGQAQAIASPYVVNAGP